MTVKQKKKIGGMTMKGHPCTSCGKALSNSCDEIYDIVFQKRIVNKTNLKSVSKMTLHHVYLCRDCAEQMHQFFSVYTGNEGYFE